MKKHVISLLMFMAINLVINNSCHASEDILILTKNTIQQFKSYNTPFMCLTLQKNGKCTYMVFFTPYKSNPNDKWILIKTANLRGEIIGRGGEIEYLQSDIFDGTGFDRNNNERCHNFSKKPFPQRRVKSCWDIGCKDNINLHFNMAPKNSTMSAFTLLYSNLGEWVLLTTEKIVNDFIECEFDKGDMIIFHNS